VHIHSKPTLLLPEKMPLFQEVLVATAFARALPSHGVSPVLFQVGETIPPSFLLHSMLHFVFSLSQWRCNLHSHGSGSTVRFQNPDGWETSSVGTDYRQQLSRVLWSHSCQRLAVLPVMPSLWGRVKRPVASIVRWLPSGMRRREQSIAATNYCPMRNATVSLLSATVEGAYYSSFVLVSSVRALYQEMYPVSRVVRKLKPAS
jgi:hypothetical protein